MASISKHTNKKGETVYRIRVSGGYLNGVQQVKSITWKASEGMTKRDITKAIDNQIMLLENAVETDQDVDFHISFQKLADEWLDLMEQTQQVKLSTLVRLKNLKERTYAAMGSMHVNQIGYRHIQKFIVSLSKDGVNQKTGGGLSEKTQRHYLSFISDIMKYAIKCGIISDNPCKNVITVKTGKKERNPYTLEEEVVLLDCLQRKAPADFSLLFSIMIYSGLRRGEVLGLEWKDIDLSTGKCTIVRTSQYRNKSTGVYTTTPKSKESARTLIFPAPLLQQIRAYKLDQNTRRVQCGEQWIDNDRLFTVQNGEPMNPNQAYTWLRAFCKAEDLPFKGLHSFRHAFATQAITSGQIDIKTVSAILGHSQVSTTLNIYTHEVSEANARALNVVSDMIADQQKKAVK